MSVPAGPNVAALRAEIAAALVPLPEEDLRVLLFVVRQLPLRRLAAELRADVLKGLRRMQATTAREHARAGLLHVLRDVGRACGVHVPSAAALVDELRGVTPEPPRPAHAAIEPG